MRNYELPLPVQVRLLSENGNAFNIIGRTTSEMRRQLRAAKWKRTDIERVCTVYVLAATSGDYGHLLETTSQYVEVI